MRWQAVETPEEASVRVEAAVVVFEQRLAGQQRKIADAEKRIAELRAALSVPDDVTALDAESAVDDPRLQPYRAYFVARQDRNATRRFSHILEMKLVAEKPDASLLPRNIHQSPP